MKYFFILILSIIYSNLLHAKDFNILDYGAKSNGKTLNTVCIQKAIDAANQKGGGRVVIPPGQFLSGSIVMKSNVELHLMKDAVLLGSTNPDDYIKINRWKGFVMADSQDNISITGEGEINGQGRRVALNIDSLFYIGKLDSADYTFPEMRPKWYLRPQLIEFVNCKHVLVKNVTLSNAACWVQTHDRGEDIVIDSVRIESDAYWNNDGIDIQDCKNVKITNCLVNSADDGICLKSQSPDHLCENIYVGNCTVRSSASAIKFGTVSHGGFKNVTIEHIKVYDTFRSAIAIECVDGGILKNVRVDDIVATNTGNAIFIRLGDRSSTKPPGILEDVTISNVKVEVAFDKPDLAYEIRGPELPFFHNPFPSSITGLPGHPVKNVTLENIEIISPGKGNDGLANFPLSRLDQVPEKEAAYPEFSMFGELPSWGLYVRHMDGLIMRNISMSIQAPDYRPCMIFDDVTNVDMKSCRIAGDHKAHRIVLHNTSDVRMDDDQGVIKL